MFSKLTDLEKCQTLIGHFYGDGSYQRQYNAKYILSKHSDVQVEYVKWLELLYQNMGIYQFATYHKVNVGGYCPNNFYSYVACKIPISSYFESPDFYQDGHKVITEAGLSQITLLGLLLWYLDDGSLSVQCKLKNGSKRHARLCTQAYTYEQHQVIQKVFDNKWNINVKIYGQIGRSTGKYYHYIYFGAKQFKKFFDLLRPYLNLIPPTMKYKFHMEYNDLNSPYNLWP